MTEADTLIQQCKSIAEQHYPIEATESAYIIEYRLRCQISLLETKLRELLYRAPALQVYVSMLPPKVAAEAVLPVAPELVVIVGGKSV